MSKDPSPLQVRLMSPIRLDMREEYDLIALATGMAHAINRFRNLPLLGKPEGSWVRRTAEFGGLCRSWEAFRDVFGHDMAIDPEVQERWQRALRASRRNRR